MSHVTDVVLTYGLCLDENDDHGLLVEINARTDRGDLTHVEDPALPEGSFHNGKKLQANIAVGAFSHLDVGEWVRRLRAEVDFTAYGCDYVQMLVQDEHDSGFRLIEVWRDA